MRSINVSFERGPEPEQARLLLQYDIDFVVDEALLRQLQYEQDEDYDGDWLGIFHSIGHADMQVYYKETTESNLLGMESHICEDILNRIHLSHQRCAFEESSTFCVPAFFRPLDDSSFRPQNPSITSSNDHNVLMIEWFATGVCALWGDVKRIFWVLTAVLVLKDENDHGVEREMIGHDFECSGAPVLENSTVVGNSVVAMLLLLLLHHLGPQELRRRFGRQSFVPVYEPAK
jgi:hypothetical protein